MSGTSLEELNRAVAILQRGGLVAFPTETVYGLGADATNARAVERVFASKGRPPANPLIVHVSDELVARRYATEWPLAASRLAPRFWPGPLTLVLPRSPAIAPAVSAGLNTVGLRVPDHPLALQLLETFAGPVAAPSANRSNRISPTTAEHVRDELGDAVDLILDGGPCSVGIESTVLDLTSEEPTILRPGGVSRQEIEAAIGPVNVASGSDDAASPSVSPGRQETHYAPRTPAYRFTGSLSADTTGAAVLLVGAERRLRRVRDVPILELPGTPEQYAQHFYAALRELDGMGRRAIFVQIPPDEPRWAAVRDRIIRATRPLEV